MLSATVQYRFPEDGDPEFLTLRIGVGQLALGDGTGQDVVVPATDAAWGERLGYVRDPERTMLLVIEDGPPAPATT